MRCSVDECDKDKIYRDGYCPMHHQRYKTHGNPLIEVKKGTRHGYAKHRIYPMWKSIKQRCYNPNTKAHKNYGARGVSLYGAWINDPALFISYIEGLKGYKDMGRLSLDRIDNDGNYEPGNLRLTTRRVQTLNQRISPRNKTGYRGVSMYRNKYRASIRADGKLLYLGDYKDREEAAYIRDQFSIVIDGREAKLNVL